SSLELGHTPLLIVQRNTYTPAALAVAVALCNVASLTVTVPGPLNLLPSPAPAAGVLPASVATKPHTSWSIPAVATVGGLSYVTCSSSLDLGHMPLLVVQRNTYTPAALAVAVALCNVASLNDTVPGPLNLLHSPAPRAAVLPASVAAKPHTSWSIPALATVGALS